MRKCTATLLLAAVAAGCGSSGSDDGARVFERAEQSLSHVRTVRAHLVVDGPVPVDRTVTIPASALPLRHLRLARWARHPRPYGCGAGLECARADLNVATAARELRPVLPPLSFDPGSVGSAQVDVTLGRSDGRLRRARLEGDLLGVHFEVDLHASE